MDAHKSRVNLWSLSTEIRLRWIFRLVLFGLLAQMLLSFSLWWKPDGVLSYLPLLFTDGAYLEKSSMVLFPVFLLLLIFNLILSDKKNVLLLFLVTGIFLITGNIHRLQVWFYFYGLILVLFLWKRRVAPEILMLFLRGVVAGVYVWSGLHKFNIHFVEDIFPWLLEPLRNFVTSFPPELAYGAGGVELLIGAGLLFCRSRNLMVIATFIFHGIILGLLGPFGHNWNHVVWPWNLVMPLLVWLLFINNKKIPVNNRGEMLRSFPAGWLVLLLVWLLPAFNYTGFTPEQLSFKMYAGSQPEMVLYYGASDRHLFDPHPAKYGNLPLVRTPRYRIVLDDVAAAEWGTPFFTTSATARRIARQFCQKMERPGEGGMLYLVDDDFVQIPCEK